MYYKTLRTSETGKRFAEADQKMSECRKAAIEMANEIGYDEWRSKGSLVVEGGVSCVLFEKGKTVDTRIWKKQLDGYYPKGNTKEGKEIISKFNEMPIVTRQELNQCVGYNSTFQNIGFCSNNSEYFLFEATEKMKFSIPEDCTEITSVEYKELARR